MSPSPTVLRTDVPSSPISADLPCSKPKGQSPSSRKLLRALTFTQLSSGVVFSSFLLIHLIPPALVAITGDDGIGSGFLTLGRVYYQGGPEPLIIYTSLTAHVVSSIILRAFYPKTLPSPRSPHSVSGFALVPLIITHLLTHRLIPSSTSNKLINALSPAELDLSFVTHTLTRYPISSSLAYIGLTFFGVWHSVGGLIITGRKAGLIKIREGGTKYWRKITSMSTWGVLGLVGLGCWRLRGSWVSIGMGKRIDEVYRVAYGLIGL
ncbi:Domain of unknown function DUF1691 [Phaffia rhodozyma]|uniref:Mitochondrial adapter protein MCP1 transmembrane domain-containing protein n=1 Tax=Phaffia rhodozyma TaxID=264483 RepID=A0A0F7SUH1_PHARH|nr:Domain of unknown function DUF1691 [Phaffia rhodozyma]